MEITPQPKLRFLGVNILNINLNAEHPIAGKGLDLVIEPKVYFPADRNNNFSILMVVILKHEDLFNLSIQAAGDFLLESDVELEANVRKMFVNVNAPAIMFPYVRSFISTLTASIGPLVNPIIIPPHFFKGDIEELKTESGGVDQINRNWDSNKIDTISK